VIRSALVVVAALVIPQGAAGLDIQPVTDGVWALVGEKDQRSPENLANNATFGVVVTEEGVLLVDPGGSWKGAAAIHDAIRRITDAPVRYIVNTGGQDHRWLGNGYWQAQGATVIAARAAVEDQRARAEDQLAALRQFLDDGIEGTEPVFADIAFEDEHILEFGGLRFEIVHPGPAHTPGDAYVWLEERDTVFTGDIVYVERILGVGPQSSIADWPRAFEAVAALDPAHVVPGHGHATTLAEARTDTYDYLTNLRARIAEHLEAGGDIIGSVEVDQSAFAHLEQFDSLARRNAQTAFEQMEWE
jgi:glyoxylase-like metal-dependent hydrolase (beta-lactamase superfamily II)